MIYTHTKLNTETKYTCIGIKYAYFVVVNGFDALLPTVMCESRMLNLFTKFVLLGVKTFFAFGWTLKLPSKFD